jgi:hypothetical protein
VVIEILYTAGSGRNETLRAIGGFLIDYLGKSTVHMVLCMYGSTCSQHGTGYQESAPAIIHAVICGSGSCLSCGIPETYGIILTGLYAVKAIHTTAVVNLVVLCIDASCLALTSALAAVYAFALINNGTHQ